MAEQGQPDDKKFLGLTGKQLTAAIVTLSCLASLVTILSYLNIKPADSQQDSRPPVTPSSVTSSSTTSTSDISTTTTQTTKASTSSSISPALISKYLSKAPSVDNAPGEYPATGSISSAIMWVMPASIGGNPYPDSVVILGGSDPVTYILGRHFRTLQGVVGITDNSDTGAYARIEIVTDGRRIFQRSMRRGQATKLKLSIIGVNELELRCAGATSGPVANCGFGDAEVVGS